MIAQLISVILIINTYLPIVPIGDIRSAAIGYGQAVSIDSGNWIDASCESGAMPLVQFDGNHVIVMCEER